MKHNIKPAGLNKIIRITTIMLLRTMLLQMMMMMMMMIIIIIIIIIINIQFKFIDVPSQHSDDQFKK